MGLLSTKKKTSVSTSISRLIEDKDYKNPLMAGVVNAVMNGAGIPDSIYYYNTHSYYNGARMAKVWASKDKYVYGELKEVAIKLPSQMLLEATVLEYLSTLHPVSSVSLHSTLMGDIDYQIAYYDYMAKLYSYDLGENKAVIENIPMYLEDAVISLSGAGIRNLKDYTGFKLHGFPFLSGKTYDRPFDLSQPHTAFLIDEGAKQNSIKASWVFQEIAVETIIEEYSLVGGAWVLESSITSVTGTIPNKPHETTIEVIGVPVGISDELVVADGKSKTVTIVTTTEHKCTYQHVYSYGDYEPVEEELPELNDASNNIIDPYAESKTVIADIDDYVSVSYLVDGLPHYEMIPLLQGVVPSIDALFVAPSQVPAVYTPRIYFRLNGMRLDGDKFVDKPAYKSSKFTTKKIGMDYAKLIEDIHESVGSLDKVKEIFMMWGVSPNNTTDPLIMKYLYLYFKKLYTNANLVNGKATPKTYTIADEVMTQAYGYNSIEKIETVVTGVGAGFYADLPTKVHVAQGNPFTNQVITTYTHWHEYSYVDEAGNKTTYRIHGLFSQNYIVNSYSSRFADKDDNLYLPFDIDLLLNKEHPFILKDRNALTAKACLVYFNTVAVVKTKWYQRGAFQLVMIFVAVALAFTGNPVGFTWMAAIKAVGVAILTNIVIDIATRILVRLGVNAQLVAIAYVIASLAVGKINGAAVTAKGMLATVNSALNIHNKMVALESAEFTKQALKTLSEIEEQTKILNAKASGLNNGVLDLILQARADNLSLAETPDQFLFRTTTVNVAQDTLEYIYGYTRNNLQLPLGATAIQQMMENSDE